MQRNEPLVFAPALGETALSRPAARLAGSLNDPTPARRPMSRQTCRACARQKPVNAFRKAPTGAAERYHAECRSCEARAAAHARFIASGGRSAAPGYKQCQRCREVLPLASFPADARCADGQANTCQGCRAAAEQRAARGAEYDLELTPDELLPPNSAAKEARMALGLAIAHATCPPGHRRTREELAAYADVTPEAIRCLEARAMAKLRAGLAEVLRAAGYTEREVAL